MNTDLVVVLLLLGAAIVMLALNKPRTDAVAILAMVTLPLRGCEEIDFRPDVATAMRVARRGEPRSGREAVIGKREG